MAVEPLKWRRMYAAAALAGAALGLVVALGLLPAIPPQLTGWLESLDNRTVGMLVTILGGALVGLALAAVAHLGVAWQLRHRFGPRND